MICIALPPPSQVSSVVYLSDASNPTVVLDQTVGGPPAERGWCVHPRKGAFMTFPGNLLHGVLPSPAPEAARGTARGAASGAGPVVSSVSSKRSAAARGTALGGASGAIPSVSSVSSKRSASTPCLGSSASAPSSQRITLLIAFYAVPTSASAKRRRLGPAAPVPRCTRAQTWPADLALQRSEPATTSPPRPLGVCAASPVWAAVPAAPQGEPFLEVPCALRQHFFMRTEDEVEARLWEEHGASGTYVKGGKGRGKGKG